MTAVLDASAILAFLHDEPGADQVRAVLDGGIVCTVNWAEVVQKALAHRIDVAGMGGELADIGVTFAPFTTEQAEIAARIWQQTRTSGLSLADRACLAVALEKSLPVLTADRAWAGLGLDIEVQLVR